MRCRELEEVAPNPAVVGSKHVALQGWAGSMTPGALSPRGHLDALPLVPRAVHLQPLCDGLSEQQTVVMYVDS